MLFEPVIVIAGFSFPDITHSSYIRA